MRVLVTGAAGFLGARLVRALLGRREVSAVMGVDDLSAGRWERLAAVRHDRRLRLVTARVEEVPCFEDWVRRADVVAHLASPVGVEAVARRPGEARRSILAAGVRVVEAAARLGRRALVVTTSEVYGFGRGGVFREEDVAAEIPGRAARLAYAQAKLELDGLARSASRAGAPILVVRPFNVVGGDQDETGGHVLPTFARAARAGRPLLLHGGGRQRRSFLWVGHAAQALARLLSEERFQDGWDTDALNLAAPGSISIRSLARRVRAALGSSSLLLPTAHPATRGGVEVERREADTTRLQALLGPFPRDTLDRALAEVAARYGRAVAAT